MFFAFLIVILVSLLVGFAAGRFRVYELQNRGEVAVRRAIRATFDTSDYHLMNNVTIPMVEGTTQIDHVLISRFGIFVIETKHYSGWIYADAASAKWTQAIGNAKFQFQNPIRQNYKHIKAVESGLLRIVPGVPVRSVVVFTGKAVFKNELPVGVFYLNGLTSHLATFQEAVLSKEALEQCVGNLECQRLALTQQTDVEHRQFLQRKYG